MRGLCSGKFRKAVDLRRDCRPEVEKFIDIVREITGAMLYSSIFLLIIICCVIKNRFT